MRKGGICLFDAAFKEIKQLFQSFNSRIFSGRQDYFSSAVLRLDYPA